jgi:hypothetical protein
MSSSVISHKAWTGEKKEHAEAREDFGALKRFTWS